MAVASGEENNDVRQNGLLHKPWVRLAIAFGVLLAGVLIVYLIIYLRLGLQWYLSPDTDLSFTKRKDLVQGLASVGQALAVGLTGAAAFIGLAFTWRNLRQTREHTQRTLELTEQGQITERFTRAIDQLGKTDDDGEPVLEIRLGGIYVLGRIAKDSPERDYGPVVEVLTAYVRENAPRESNPRHSEKFSRLASAWNWLNTRWAKKDEGASQDALSERQSLRADIQAILVVLARRQKDKIPDEYYVRFNLDKTDLRRAHLTEQPDLRDSGLWRANLQEANRTGADLRKADLEEAILKGAKLQNANLTEARLQGADLQGADLLGAIVTDEQLADAQSLKGATMTDGTEHP